MAVQKGISLAAVQKSLGHYRLTTTAIYLNLTDGHVLEEFKAKWWGTMPAIHETSYPRLKEGVMTAELAKVYKPTAEELALPDRSEIKLVDILLGEEERLAEQDVVALDLDRSQPAGLQFEWRRS